MNIFDPINRSQALVQRIASQLTSNETDLTELLTELSTHLNEIKLNTHNLNNKLSKYAENQKNSCDLDAENTLTKPALKSGCYIFEGEKGYFCPNCYDRDRTKAATTRINSKLRVCPVCRASLKLFSKNVD
ncbi:MAG: hypothetical protein OEY48_07785 [Gammaproteobacteria bacterium]|nr:hypothetical protein [Gammaproteobacteria bacterium]MDH5592733.1 hypothetical protein [Gammaproteobacteria bacterium]